MRYHDRKSRKCKYCSAEVRRNIQANGRNKGFYRTCGSKKCLQQGAIDPTVIAKKAHHGSAHPCWISDRSKLKFRPRYEMTLWKKAVYERDNYTCQTCGKRGERLNADHIKPYATYPELRWELSNGRTLCETCHKKTPTYGRKVGAQLAL